VCGGLKSSQGTNPANTLELRLADLARKAPAFSREATSSSLILDHQDKMAANDQFYIRY
jgi:hypothetical protein